MHEVSGLQPAALRPGLPHEATENAQAHLSFPPAGDANKPQEGKAEEREEARWGITPSQPEADGKTETVKGNEIAKQNTEKQKSVKTKFANLWEGKKGMGSERVGQTAGRTATKEERPPRGREEVK